MTSTSYVAFVLSELTLLQVQSSSIEGVSTTFTRLVAATGTVGRRRRPAVKARSSDRSAHFFIRRRHPAVGTKKIIFLCSTTFVPLPYRGVREGMIVGVGIKSIPTRTNTSALSLRENKSFALPVSVHRTLFDHRSCRTPIIVS